MVIRVGLGFLEFRSRSLLSCCYYSSISTHLLLAIHALIEPMRLKWGLSGLSAA